MKKIFGLLSIAILLVGCPSDEDLVSQSLLVKNTTNERIYFWFSYDFTFYHYPNINLPADIPLYFNSAPANSGAGNDVGQSPKWDVVFSQLPEGKFSIYFFDKLATTQEEWEDIRVNNMVLRKDVTFDELKNNNYTIFYP
jgi:hypothetical protein